MIASKVKPILLAEGWHGKHCVTPEAIQLHSETCHNVVICGDCLARTEHQGITLRVRRLLACKVFVHMCNIYNIYYEAPPKLCTYKAVSPAPSPCCSWRLASSACSWALAASTSQSARKKDMVQRAAAHAEKAPSVYSEQAIVTCVCKCSASSKTMYLWLGLLP